MSSFSTALSGLAANSTALDIVGNNLANLNTEGFKSDDVLFQNVMGQTSGLTQIGAGVGTPQTIGVFTQGSIQSTAGPLDAAIQGDGFFVVKNSAGNTLYTRAGSFHVDASGNLVTSAGDAVLGWSATNSVLNPSGPVSTISVAALAAQPPSATTKVSITLNLDATDATNASFSTPIQVVDSLGVSHTLTVTFQKTGSNAWTYAATIPGEDLKGGTAGTPSPLATGTLAFDNSGALKTPAFPGNVNLKTTGGLASGANDLNINWSLFSADGTSQLTQFAQTSAESASSQDGQVAATVTGVQLSAGGTLEASYSNGKQIPIAQIALASIGNPESLISTGNNNYQLGATTLAPSLGMPSTGHRGNILGGSIELSNVDLAREFTNLIVYQRGYQANSKVITTLDQLDQVLLNMKA